ncbi:hypothetical protein [Adhaeribacter radiodurans]|uniref:Uncharacterized protein n=1 Tax=Adhaeribacter radiodurans TaxID=2745197 RepID=A0A7L7L896_9BACT|nr:hypothetical protein [Adhaeribacter radiodurans]QMU28775.1 hypothetical protein HUW48_12340 [Adhaeribacter radiodurans]
MEESSMRALGKLDKLIHESMMKLWQGADPELRAYCSPPSLLIKQSSDKTVKDLANSISNYLKFKEVGDWYPDISQTYYNDQTGTIISSNLNPDRAVILVNYNYIFEDEPSLFVEVTITKNELYEAGEILNRKPREINEDKWLYYVAKDFQSFYEWFEQTIKRMDDNGEIFYE